jgi:hypothetical protein
MPAEISAQLREKLEAAGAEEPVPVIVTLTPGTETEGLERQGLRVQRAFENAPLLSGVIAANRVEALAESDGVTHIEYDGEVHAL